MNHRMKNGIIEDVVVVAVLIAFGAVWALWLIPLLQSGTWFTSLNPVLQYVIYNVGVLSITGAVFLVIYRAFRGRTRVRWFQVLLSSVGLFIVSSFAIDMWDPPLYLNWAGEILIDNPQALTGIAVDAMVAWVYASWGASGPWLFTLVYLVTPVVALLLGVVLLSPRFIYGFVGVHK